MPHYRTPTPRATVWRMAAGRETPAQKALSDERLGEHGLDVTKLAWKLVGPEAAEKQMKGKRRLIQKWREGKNEPSLRSAIALSRVLGGPPTRFRSVRPRASDWRREIEARIDEIAVVVDQLRPLLKQQTATRKGKR